MMSNLCTMGGIAQTQSRTLNKFIKTLHRVNCTESVLVWGDACWPTKCHVATTRIWIFILVIIQIALQNNLNVWCSTTTPIDFFRPPSSAVLSTWLLALKWKNHSSPQWFVKKSWRSSRKFGRTSRSSSNSKRVRTSRRRTFGRWGTSTTRSLVGWQAIATSGLTRRARVRLTGFKDCRYRSWFRTTRTTCSSMLISCYEGEHRTKKT